MQAPEAVPAAPVVTEQRRRELLAQTIAARIAGGQRVESQGEYQAVVVRGHRCNHLLHFIIGIFTLTLWWIFVWAPIWIFGGEKRTLIQVDPFGNVTEAKV